MRSEFQLNDDELAQAVKQVGRAELKNRMRHWDKQEDNSAKVHSINNRANVASVASIGYSWVKYAVAASFIGCLVWAGIFLNNKSNNGSVAKIKKTENIPLQKFKLGSSDSTIQRVKVYFEQSLGFAYAGGTKETVTILFLNVNKQINAVDSVIATESKGNSVYDISNEQLKKIKDSLVQLNGSTLFDGKTLVLYSQKEKATVIRTSKDVIYLKLGDSFYWLKKSTIPMPLQKVKDAKLVEQLSKILFDNE